MTAVVPVVSVDSSRLTPSVLSFMCTETAEQEKGSNDKTPLPHMRIFLRLLVWLSADKEGEEKEKKALTENIAGASSSLRLLVLLADALLPGVLPLVLSVAVRGVEDPAGQRDGLRRQLLLGDAALSQVGFGRHGRRLRPAVGDVVRAVTGCVVVGRRPVGVAVHPRVGMSVGMRVVVWVRSGAAVVERADLVHGVDLRSAVVDVQVGRCQVLLGRGPQVTGKRLQGVVPDGARLWILASEVALTQRGNAAAGTAGQGGVTATQS